jgi:hypothetical protein
MDLTNCRKGNHDLKVISKYGYEEITVVRWCRICGAIVVDVDYDGITHFGYVMPMKLPEITIKECQHA